MARIPTSACEKTFRAGTIWAHIETEESTGPGSRTPRRSVRILRHWKDDRDGKWRTTTYFRPDDLPKLILVASKAYEYVMLHEVNEDQEPVNDTGGDRPAEEVHDGA